ncbi:MAG: arginine--tRNA ligase, partial [Thermosulfidibacteraceae bacterium]
MKQYFRSIVEGAIEKLVESGLPIDRSSIPIIIEYPDKKYGDYSTNVAFTISRILKKKPYDVAQILVDKIHDPNIEKIEVSGGFINFRVKRDFWYMVLERILKEREKYGSLNVGQGKRVNIEFVSANPTGPLHVGHGRGAVVGDSLARLLE